MLTLFNSLTTTSRAALIATITFATTATISSPVLADSETNALIAGSVLGLAIGLSVDRPTTEVHRTTIIERSPPRYSHSFYRERDPYYDRHHHEDRRIHRRYSTAQEAYYGPNQYPRHPHRNYSTQHQDTHYYYQPQSIKETQITIRETLPSHQVDTGKRIIIK